MATSTSCSRVAVPCATRRLVDGRVVGGVPIRRTTLHTDRRFASSGYRPTVGRYTRSDERRQKCEGTKQNGRQRPHVRNGRERRPTSGARPSSVTSVPSTSRRVGSSISTAV